jgi:hypothetical protein
MSQKQPSEALLESIDHLINQARRTWADLDIHREAVYGCASATFDNDANLVVMRVQNNDGEDALVAVAAEEYLLFALRLLNKRYEDKLARTLSHSGMN